MDLIKKIFEFLSALPAFTNLFSKAVQTGKVDPIEALTALSSVSPGTKKVSDTAMTKVISGGGVSEASKEIEKLGEIEVLGEKINTRTVISDLRRFGGICSIFANILESMKNQNAEDIVKFGESASEVSNWKDLLNQSRATQ